MPQPQLGLAKISLHLKLLMQTPLRLLGADVSKLRVGLVVSIP